MALENIFIEQAEYLDTTSFDKWAIEHPKEREIVRKLCSTGSKLLIGPRGCGKTTLLLKAHHKMMEHKANAVLSVYINFKESLRLEPIYKSNANAVFWFSQWLYLKTLVGIESSVKQLTEKSIDGFESILGNAARVISALQVGDIHLAKSLLGDGVSLNTLEAVVAKALDSTDRQKIVLLLDDAGHAFSPEQQREFFDFFRTIKSSTLAPKAAVYPGVTEYSSTFHTGHDAEEINVWVDPSSKEYLDFMFQLLERRLPNKTYAKIKANSEMVSLLAYASFGIPRNLLNMIRFLSVSEDDETSDPQDDSDNTTITLARKKVFEAISSCSATSFNIFKSLRVKIPIYSKFIDEGDKFFFRLIDTIKQFNAKTSTNTKSLTIALPKPLAPEIHRLIGLFQYSGLLMPKKADISRGKDGNFALFDVHYAFLIDRNAIVPKTSVSIAELVSSISKRSAQAFTRTTSSKLLGSDDIGKTLSLMLPPCQVCGTERITPEAKFCLNCGAQLALKSTFEIAVNQDISVLPLTQRRVTRIKNESNIRTIKDILLDHDHKELRKVEQVGKVWATRIARYAEEFIA